VPAGVNGAQTPHHRSGSGPARDDCRTTHAGLPNQTASCKPSSRPNRIYANFVAENAPTRPTLAAPRMHPTVCPRLSA